MPGKVRARIRIEGSLAFIETELGERAVVPVNTLCRTLRRLGIEPAWGDRVDCPEAIEVGSHELAGFLSEDSGEFEGDSEE